MLHRTPFSSLLAQAEAHSQRLPVAPPNAVHMGDDTEQPSPHGVLLGPIGHSF